MVNIKDLQNYATNTFWR